MSEIKIIPVGKINSELLDYLSLILASGFGKRCTLADTTVNPAIAFDPARQQYESTRLLRVLFGLNSSIGDRILGVTQVDLFIPILTFVFGEAQLDGRVALISTHRLRQEFYGLPEDKSLFYARSEKEAVHELGHAYGLIHCPSFGCVMHYSNSIEQVDLKASSFCVSCQLLLQQKTELEYQLTQKKPATAHLIE